MESPILSVIVILNDFFHLASLTLKSIFNQKDPSYEVIVVENSEAKRELIMLKPYLDKIKLLELPGQNNIANLMNAGVKESTGRYIHFLFAGDSYLSIHTVGHLKNILEKEKNPEMVFFSFLQKDGSLPPSAMEYSKNCFQKDNFPVNITCAVLRRDVIEKMHGFNNKYRYRAGFELLCRLFLQKDIKIAFSKRVLTDYEFKKKSSREKISIFWENIKIFNEHYGIFKTFIWAFFYYNFKLIKMFFISLKKAFWPA